MKALTILFAISITVAVWGCSDQPSPIGPAGNTTTVHESGTTVNTSGEILVDEVVSSTSLKSSYRVTGTLVYNIVLKGRGTVITTGLALSVENDNPAKNEAYTLTTGQEQEVHTDSKGPSYASESHVLGEGPSADKVMTLKYEITEEGSLSVQEVRVEQVQTGNHW